MISDRHGPYRQLYRKQFMGLRDDSKLENGIPKEELRERLERQKGSLRLKDSQIEALLAEADKDGDDKITAEEFELLVTSAQAQTSQVKRALYAVADRVTTKAQQIEVHSYIDAWTLCPPPIFILLSSALQVALFFYFYFTDPAATNVWTYCSGCYINNTVGPLIFAPPLRHEVWRFLTYQFSHVGLSHLLGNLVIQLIVGFPLEIVHKPMRIAPLYTLAVIAGAMLQYTGNPEVYLVGASAGVYALITAHVANLLMNWSEMPMRWIWVVVFSVFLGYDIGGVLVRRYIFNVCDEISHMAHLAGGITGFLFGIFVLLNIVVHQWERYVKWASLATYAVFFASLIVLTIIQKPFTDSILGKQNCKISN